MAVKNQAVLIKSNKYGLVVVLDRDMVWDELKEEVAGKFSSSAKFFGEAQMAVCFQGRELTTDEERELIEVISSSCQIQIVCLVDEDENRELFMKEAVEKTLNAAKSVPSDYQDGRFYKGTLRSGQVLESQTSIVVLGDVNPGARLISGGNVIVLGCLKGNVYVGASGRENCFVAALSMDPMQIRIGDVIARSSDSAPRKRKKADDTPKIAFVEDGSIYIEPITKEVLSDIDV